MDKDIAALRGEIADMRDAQDRFHSMVRHEIVSLAVVIVVCAIAPALPLGKIMLFLAYAVQTPAGIVAIVTVVAALIVVPQISAERRRVRAEAAQREVALRRSDAMRAHYWRTPDEPPGTNGAPEPAALNRWGYPNRE